MIYKTTFFLTVLFSAVTLFAGNTEKKLDHFNEVKASGNFKVFLIKSDEEKAIIVNNDEELTDDKIQVEVKGSTLNIGTQEVGFKKYDLEIKIYYTDMLSITATNEAWIEAENDLEGEKVELTCRTGGIVKAKLACKTVDCSIFTSGTMRLSGETEVGEYKVSTGGFISAIDLKAKTVDAKISTGGEISCHGTEKMDLKVTMGGTIKYRFDGDKSNLNAKTSIGGDITKFDK